MIHLERRKARYIDHLQVPGKKPAFRILPKMEMNHPRIQLYLICVGAKISLISIDGSYRGWVTNKYTFLPGFNTLIIILTA